MRAGKMREEEEVIERKGDAGETDAGRKMNWND